MDPTVYQDTLTYMAKKYPHCINLIKNLEFDEKDMVYTKYLPVTPITHQSGYLKNIFAIYYNKLYDLYHNLNSCDESISL